MTVELLRDGRWRWEMVEEPVFDGRVAVVAMALMSALLEKMLAKSLFTRREIAEMIEAAETYADLLNHEGATAANIDEAVRILQDMKQSYRDDPAID